MDTLGESDGRVVFVEASLVVTVPPAPLVHQGKAVGVRVDFVTEMRVDFLANILAGNERVGLSIAEAVRIPTQSNGKDVFGPRATLHYLYKQPGQRVRSTPDLASWAGVDEKALFVMPGGTSYAPTTYVENQATLARVQCVQSTKGRGTLADVTTAGSTPHQVTKPQPGSVPPVALTTAQSLPEDESTTIGILPPSNASSGPVAKNATVAESNSTAPSGGAAIPHASTFAPAGTDSAVGGITPLIASATTSSTEIVADAGNSTDANASGDSSSSSSIAVPVVVSIIIVLLAIIAAVLIYRRRDESSTRTKKFAAGHEDNTNPAIELDGMGRTTDHPVVMRALSQRVKYDRSGSLHQPRKSMAPDRDDELFRRSRVNTAYNDGDPEGSEDDEGHQNDYEYDEGPGLTSLGGADGLDAYGNGRASVPLAIPQHYELQRTPLNEGYVKEVNTDAGQNDAISQAMGLRLVGGLPEMSKEELDDLLTETEL